MDFRDRKSVQLWSCSFSTIDHWPWSSPIAISDHMFWKGTWNRSSNLFQFIADYFGRKTNNSGAIQVIFQELLKYLLTAQKTGKFSFSKVN